MSGLVLGLPSGVSDVFISDPDEPIYFDPIQKYHRSLTLISGMILRRNESPTTTAFAATQEIDEKLETLAKTMSSSWWEIPQAFTSADDALIKFNRVWAQIHHYQLESLVHLPFMLRAATDRRYEYSKSSCLRASRELIRRWLYFRTETKGMFCKSRL